MSNDPERPDAGKSAAVPAESEPTAVTAGKSMFGDLVTVVPAVPPEPKPATKPQLTLDVRAIRVVQTLQTTPAGDPIDIVEIELLLPNDGNFAWFAWHDHLRFRVERGHADEALTKLGLKK